MVSLAQTNVEFQQIITVLRQWRAYPARTHKVSLEAALIRESAWSAQAIRSQSFQRKQSRHRPFRYSFPFSCTIHYTESVFHHYNSPDGS